MTTVQCSHTIMTILTLWLLALSTTKKTIGDQVTELILSLQSSFKSEYYVRKTAYTKNASLCFAKNHTIYIAAYLTPVDACHSVGLISIRQCSQTNLKFRRKHKNKNLFILLFGTITLALRQKGLRWDNALPLSNDFKGSLVYSRGDQAKMGHLEKRVLCHTI